MAQPMLIAPFKTGLDIEIDPWIAPPDSFQDLVNLHINQGRLEKRQGYLVFGALTPNDSSPKNIVDITNADPASVEVASHGFSTGDFVFIADAAGLTAFNNKIFEIIATGTDTFTIGVDSTDLGTYSGSGTASLVDSDIDRVMGIYRYIKPSDGTQELISFNTTTAFIYNSASQVFVPLEETTAAGTYLIMNGGVYDYITAVNWQASAITNRLYFTNGLEWNGSADPDARNGIRYFDGGSDTAIFTPVVSTGSPSITLYGAKFIFSLNQRLIVLFTYENNTSSTESFPQRARWSAKQNPAKWDDVTAGGGDYSDAATGEQIISAQSLQNQLIVFFTNSVWALIPTSDPNRAFRWKKLNSFRACDGKMASVSYDRFSKALGIRGITGTDGNDTQRIDDRIHSFVVDQINVGEFKKVFCGRSYANRRWWTLYPDNENIENNAALIYDDESGAFSTYDVNLNCLGYGNFSRDFALEDFTESNNLDLSLDDEEIGDATLQDYYWQDEQETFLGGDIVGNVYILETSSTDNGTTIETNLLSAYWNPFKDQGAEALLPYIDLYVETSISAKAALHFFKDNESAPYLSQNFDFLPNLDYVVSINNAAQANPCSVNAPSHGLSTGDSIYIYNVEGMISINSGETDNAYMITVVDNNNFTLDGVDSTLFNAYTGGGEIYLRPFYRTKTWKRVFAGGIGFQHQIQIVVQNNDASFTIDAFKPYFKKIGRRTIN